MLKFYQGFSILFLLAGNTEAWKGIQVRMFFAQQRGDIVRGL